MKNRSIHRVLYDLTNLFLNFLSELLSDKKPSNGNKIYADKFFKWLETRHSRFQNPEWFIIIHNVQEKLKEHDLYDKFKALLSGDPVISTQMDKLTGYYGIKVRTDIDNTLSNFLYAYLLSSKNISSIDSNNFERLYSEFEDYFYSETVKIRTIAPLYNFQMDNDQIQLSENLRLVRVSENEIAGSFAGSIVHGFSTTYEQIAFEGFGIEYIEDCQKIVSDNQQEPSRTPEIRGIFDSVISALRLHKIGNVSYSFVKTEPVGWNPLTVSFSSPLRSPSVYFGERYNLQSNGVRDFVSLWTKLATISDKKRFLISLRRFNFAYERINAEDELIDYLIGLEALLIPSVRQELSYRLSLRCSFFVAQNVQERAEVYYYVRKAYDVRSSLVHGDEQPSYVKVRGTSVAFKDFLVKIKAIMRQVLLIYLEVAKDRKEDDVLKSIDSDILNRNGFV